MREVVDESISLEYNNSELFWDGCNLSRLADEYQTPLHVLSKNTLMKSIKNFLIPFNNERLPVRIHFSVKTNPVPGFLQLLKEENLGVEIISDFELQLVRRLEFSAEKIIINGPAKSFNLLNNIKNIQVKMITIESIEEFKKVQSFSDSNNIPLRVSFRICPGFSLAKIKPTLSSSSKDSPYGFLPDSPDLWEALKIISKDKNLVFTGFHIHLGSGIKSSGPYQKAFSILYNVVKRAGDLGCKSRLLDIGGGFGNNSSPVLSLPLVAYLMFRKKPFQVKRNLEDKLLNTVAKNLRELLFRLKSSGNPIEEVLIEPGRAISGKSQMVILTVLDLIERPNGRRFLICDGGAMSLSPLLLTEYHRIIPLLNRKGKDRNYTVLGNLPSTLDRVTPSATLPSMRTGDKLVILDTGAYFVPFNNNFSGPRPAIVLINKGKLQLLRRRETFEDIYQRDLCF